MVTPSVTATGDTNLNDVTEISSELYVRPTIVFLEPCIIFCQFIYLFTHTFTTKIGICAATTQSLRPLYLLYLCQADYSTL